MGCISSKTNDIDYDNNSNKQFLNCPMLIKENENNHQPLSVLGELVSNNNDYSNNVSQNIFNLNNLNRWRGLDNFKFNDIHSNGCIIASTPTIKHCIHNIQINVVKYNNGDIQVSICLPENIFNQLEIDIKSLNCNCLTTLFCKTEYDLIDAINSLQKIIPEMSEIFEILINKYPIFKS